MRIAVVERGTESSKVHTETFGPDPSLTPGIAAAPEHRPHPPDGVPGAGPLVSFTRSGLTLPWDTRSLNLLEFAEACEVPVRWSCRTGVCHMCECALVHMRLANLLLFNTLALTAQDSKLSGPSDANRPVSEGDIRIVRRAREILNSPTKWNRADNRECPATQRTYSLYCALEKASEKISKTFTHRGGAMQQARFVIDEVLAKGNNYEHRLKDYNNDPKTTFADVQKFFTLLEERIQKRLTAQSRR